MLLYGIAITQDLPKNWRIYNITDHAYKLLIDLDTNLMLISTTIYSSMIDILAVSYTHLTLPTKA